MDVVSNKISGKSNTISIGLIVFGLIQPLLIKGIVIFIYNYTRMLSFITESPRIIKTFIFAGIMNSLPYIVLSIFVMNFTLQSNEQKSMHYFINKIAIINTAFFTLVVSSAINFEIWRGIELHLKGSSTSVLAFIFLPIILIIIMPVEYFMGRTIGVIIFKRRQINF